MNRFCHLRIRSDFSLLNSSIKIDDIVDYCKSEKSLAVGIMDDMSLSSGLAFSEGIKKLKSKPLIGMNVFIHKEHYSQDKSLPYIGLIAKNEIGYGNLLKLLYYAYEKTENINTFGQRYVRMEDLANFKEGLICITGGFNGVLGYEFFNFSAKEAKEASIQLRSIFLDNLYIEITRHGRSKEAELEKALISIAYDISSPVIATNDVHFLAKEHFDAFDALTCIRNKTFISDDNRECLNQEYYLKSEAEMTELFSDIPEAIANTVQIAKRCSYLISKREPRLPSFSATEEIDEGALLRRNGLAGLGNRLQKVEHAKHIEYQERFEYEMSIITKMGFCGYFLIVGDFISWAKNNGIAVGPGRGSGAGSIIAWCLGITNADPIKYGLIFERFLNPERISMPDFDIDFCQERRGEVVDYVVQKYGKNRVASIITYGKLQAKAVLKDVARVMQIPFPKVDAISRMIPFNPLDPVTLEKALELDPKLRSEVQKDDEIQELISIGMILEGLNRHSSTHAAGIIVADKDILDIAPLYIDPESTLPILGYDMKDAEKIGLVKFDFLGLKTMTVISKACELVKDHYGIKINVDELNYDDQKTFNLLASGHLKGVFQLESVIAKNALAKINVHSLDEIADITSLIRPGPMENLPSYIRRKNEDEIVDYYYDILRDLLLPTCGIIIYQEQVVEVARLLAGYSRGEGDILRRAMGKKIKEEMDKQCEVFVTKATQVGIINKEQAERMFHIIAKFAGYGFNKAHAIAYSIISYQTAYLKAHYAPEFIATSLNLDLADTNAVSAFINDAKRLNLTIENPNINKSLGCFSCTGNSIIYGLSGIKGIGEGAALAIQEERLQNGEFKSIEDFLNRCCNILNKKILEGLIKSGSFDVFKVTRKTLIENVAKIIEFTSECKANTVKVENNSLFGEEKTTPNGIQFKHFPEYNKIELLNNEFEVFGFYLSEHPLKQYEELLKENDVLFYGDLEDLASKNSDINVTMCGSVIKIIQRFKGKTRFAFLHLVDLDGVFETMIFKDDLIIENRDNLIEGKNLIVSVNIKNSADYGIRISVNKIFTIEDLIKDNTLWQVLQEYNSRGKRRPPQKSVTPKSTQLPQPADVAQKKDTATTTTTATDKNTTPPQQPAEKKPAPKKRINIASAEDIDNLDPKEAEGSILVFSDGTEYAV